MDFVLSGLVAMESDENLLRHLLVVREDVDVLCGVVEFLFTWPVDDLRNSHSFLIDSNGQCRPIFFQYREKRSLIRIEELLEFAVVEERVRWSYDKVNLFSLKLCCDRRRTIYDMCKSVPLLLEECEVVVLSSRF